MLKISIHKFNSVILISSCLPLGKPHWLQTSSVWVLASLHGAPEKVRVTTVFFKKRSVLSMCVHKSRNIYIYLEVCLVALELKTKCTSELWSQQFLVMGDSCSHVRNTSAAQRTLGNTAFWMSNIFIFCWLWWSGFGAGFFFTVVLI